MKLIGTQTLHAAVEMTLSNIVNLDCSTSFKCSVSLLDISPKITFFVMAWSSGKLDLMSQTV